MSESSKIYLEIMNEIKDLELLGKENYNKDILNSIENLVDDIELKYNELLNTKKEAEQSLESITQTMSQEKNKINDEKISLQNRLNDLTKLFEDKKNELEKLTKETKDNAEEQKRLAQETLEKAMKGADEDKAREIENKLKEVKDSYNNEKDAINKQHELDKKNMKDEFNKEKETIKQMHKERLEQIKGQINDLKINKKNLEDEKNNITNQLKRVELKLKNLQQNSPASNIPVAQVVPVADAIPISTPNKDTESIINDNMPTDQEIKEQIKELNKYISHNAKYANALPPSQNEKRKRYLKRNKELQKKVENLQAQLEGSKPKTPITENRPTFRIGSRGGYRYGADLASIHPSNIRSISPFSKIQKKTRKTRKSNKKSKTKKINRKYRKKGKSRKRINKKKNTRKR